MTDTQSAGVRKSLLPALAQMSGVQTLPDLFERRIVLTPNGEAYRQFDEASGQWRSFTWRQMGDLVARWRRALMAQGLQARGHLVGRQQGPVFRKDQQRLGQAEIRKRNITHFENSPYGHSTTERLATSSPARRWRFLLLGDCPGIRRPTLWGASRNREKSKRARDDARTARI